MAATGVLCYGVLVHYLMNRKHKKNEKLTARLKEWIAASEKALKGRVINNGGWREKWGAVRVNLSKP